ncbi:MAG TPA: hypothetical protein ENK15_09570 [Thermopetrobacter sp.]|nr:hypothetical protein [Thermopetrobacter sp.]
MNTDHIRRLLGDERCGLYLLATFDERAAAEHDGVLTVHAAAGAITPENVAFIEASVARVAPGMPVRIRRHAATDLHGQDCLENFARLFGEGRIVADPTGSFARVSGLIRLALLIRAECWRRVERVLWHAEERRLIVQAASGDDASLRARIRRLIDANADDDLRGAIAAIEICAQTPEEACIPVDVLSRRPPAASPPPAARERNGGLLARLSKIAAIAGLSSVSAAAAGAADIPPAERASVSGIAALVGLTTLGENSFGARNRHQAVGGLRLYFGEAGVKAAAVSGDVRALDTATPDAGPDNAAQRRVRYPAPAIHSQKKA